MQGRPLTVTYRIAKDCNRDFPTSTSSAVCHQAAPATPCKVTRIGFASDQLFHRLSSALKQCSARAAQQAKMVAPRMSIKFLGTSSMPNSTRNYSSLLFKLDNHTVMVDCGEGTQRQFRSRYVGVDEKLANLKTILITHLHADHVLGLVPLLMSIMGPTGNAAPMESASPRVEIYGPPGLRALIRTTFPCATLNSAANTWCTNSSGPLPINFRKGNHMH